MIYNSLHMALILFFLSIVSTWAQKAILISSSLGYYNIRQVNNIVKIYHHLRHNGFRDQDILLLIGQMQACCQKNHRFNTLSFYDSDITNIFKDIQVDYYQSQITLQSFANMLMSNYPQYTLNKRKLQLSQNQPLFIYVTGHGGDTYFKIRQRQALIDEQFARIFNILANKNITKSIAVISDSCSAITPFQKVQTRNFIALGSSSFGEKSLSHGFDVGLNQPKSDDFSFYFDQVLSEKAIMKGVGSSIDNWTFRDLQKYMDKQKLKVNSKLISNKISKNQKLSKYIKRKQSQVKFYRHSRNITIQQFLNS